MHVEAFYDVDTSTLTYVVWDQQTKDAVVIDPVLDYDLAASRTGTDSVDRVEKYIREQALKVHYILETHAHADHLSGSQELRKRIGPEIPIAIGDKITVVQETFKQVFDLPSDFPTDGRQFDKLLGDGEAVEAGSLRIETIHTPGHTPACATYKIGNAVFTGDALFMPDMGTGRCDFPAGSARDLYNSVARKIYALPDDTRVFVGHDYQPGGRDLKWETSVGEEKKSNIQLTGETTEDEFVEFRMARDKKLNAPRLLFQSVQVNVDAGRLPEPHDNEIRYLKIPINAFKPTPGGEVEEREL